MSYVTRCDMPDLAHDIDRNERVLEVRLMQESGMPVACYTFCVEHGMQHGQLITSRFFSGVWAKLEAQWRDHA